MNLSDSCNSGGTPPRPLPIPWTLSQERRLRELIAEKLRRRRDERLRYWIPNGGQEKYLAEIFRPGAFIVVNGSGNGGGKTYGIIALAGAIMWPAMAPACMAHESLIQKWPHPKRARIISTPKEVEEIGSIQTTIQELWPKGRFEPIRKGKHYPSQFKTDTGWVLDVMTYEQDKGEFAGPNIGLTIFNEPMPEPIWRESIARTRRGGLVLVAMTSLYEHPWVVDGILNKADGKNTRVLYCDACENCKQHGKNGTLEHEQIEKILDQYPEDEREARKTGKPLSLSGAIFKGFSRQVHVTKELIVPPASGVTHYQAADPAIGKPFASIWAYVDATGAIHIYDEYPDRDFHGARDAGLSVKDYVEAFKIKEAGRNIAVRILDRHFGNQRHAVGGMTLKAEFEQAGMEFRDSYKVAEAQPEVETGILKVKDYLRYDKSKDLDALNRPKLYISPNCKNTIAAMERWSRNPDTGKPMEDFKDHADCVRYLCMANPEHDVAGTFEQPSRPHYVVNT